MPALQWRAGATGHVLRDSPLRDTSWASDLQDPNCPHKRGRPYPRAHRRRPGRGPRPRPPRGAQTQDDPSTDQQSPAHVRLTAIHHGRDRPILQRHPHDDLPQHPHPTTATAHVEPDRKVIPQARTRGVRKAEARKYKRLKCPLAKPDGKCRVRPETALHRSQTGHILRWRSVTDAKNHEVPKPIT